jgi:ribosomal protein S18 acetylase RimI-like enzyme
VRPVAPHDPASAVPVRRLLTAADAEAFATLRRTVVADCPRGMGLTLAEEHARSPAGVRAQLSGKPPGAVFGVFVGEALVSTAGIVWPTASPSGAHKAVLWSVATAPASRRRGFARALAAQAVLHAFQHGARRVYLSVYLPNPEAVRLYETLGFVATGRELEALRLGDEYFDIEYMSLAAAEATPALAALAGQALSP